MLWLNRGRIKLRTIRRSRRPGGDGDTPTLLLAVSAGPANRCAIFKDRTRSSGVSVIPNETQRGSNPADTSCSKQLQVWRRLDVVHVVGSCVKPPGICCVLRNVGGQPTTCISMSSRDTLRANPSRGHLLEMASLANQDPRVHVIGSDVSRLPVHYRRDVRM